MFRNGLILAILLTFAALFAMPGGEEKKETVKTEQAAKSGCNYTAKVASKCGAKTQTAATTTATVANAGAKDVVCVDEKGRAAKVSNYHCSEKPSCGSTKLAKTETEQTETVAKTEETKDGDS